MSPTTMMGDIPSDPSSSVLTVTVNPSLDTTSRIDHVDPNLKLRETSDAADSAEMIRAAEAEEDSRIGAGDSMVAGIIATLIRGESFGSAARQGVAAGTAAGMTPATELCRREDAESIMDAVGVT